MTYTQKMHDSIRRNSEGKNATIVTDLLDEIERLQEEKRVLFLFKSAYYNLEQENNELRDKIKSLETENKMLSRLLR
jgi:hypothetical protein